MNDTPQAIHTILQHVAAVYARESDKQLQERFGFGFSQYRILSSIKDNAALRQKHIAFELGQTEASISRQIRLLRDRGLLMVRLNPDNRREHRVVISPKGERLMEAAQEVLANYQSGVISHLSKSQQAQLLELLTTIYH